MRDAFQEAEPGEVRELLAPLVSKIEMHFDHVRVRQGQPQPVQAWDDLCPSHRTSTIHVVRKFCDSRGVQMRVDRQAGVIRGVKVLGLESRNGRSYLPEALAQAAPLYEDAKVNVNHPRGNPGGPRDYQDRIGTVRNVGLRAGEGLFADFHFNPKHALAEQLIWDAEHAPENVGFSHNVEARCARRGDRVVVEAITRVQSVDLVADPATTRGLFESQQTSPLSLTERRRAADAGTTKHGHEAPEEHADDSTSP